MNVKLILNEKRNREICFPEEAKWIFPQLNVAYPVCPNPSYLNWYLTPWVPWKQPKWWEEQGGKPRQAMEAGIKG